MTDTGAPRPQGRVSYRLVSLLLSGALLVAGVAILYEKIDWRELTAVWTRLDPTLVALAVAIYWLVYPINTFRFHRVILWAIAGAHEGAPSLKFLFRLTCSAGFLALALAADGVLRRLGNRTGTMPLKHLPRDGVDLRPGCHGELPP